MSAVTQPVIIGYSVLHLPLPYRGEPAVRRGPGNRAPIADSACGLVVNAGVFAPEAAPDYPVCSRCLAGEHLPPEELA